MDNDPKTLEDTATAGPPVDGLRLSSGELARDVLAQALDLTKAKRSEEALDQYTKLLVGLEKSDDARAARCVALVLRNKAVILGKLNRNDESAAVWDQLIDRFGSDDGLPVASQVAVAWMEKVGKLQRALKRSEESDAWSDVSSSTEFGGEQGIGAGGNSREAREIYLAERSRQLAMILEICDTVIARFGTRDELPLATKVAVAFLAKAQALQKTDRIDEAIAAWDQLTARLGLRDELAIAHKVAAAWVGKSIELDRSAQTDEAIATCKQVIERFGSREEPPLSLFVAGAMLLNAGTFYKTRRNDEALAISRELIDKFSDDARPVLQTYVRTAKHIAFALGAR